MEQTKIYEIFEDDSIRVKYFKGSVDSSDQRLKKVAAEKLAADKHRYSLLADAIADIKTVLKDCHMSGNQRFHNQMRLNALERERSLLHDRLFLAGVESQ